MRKTPAMTFDSQFRATSGNASDALLAGSDWSTGGGKTQITYSFATSGDNYAVNTEYAASFASFSEADKAVTRELLAAIAAVCNVNFVEVADTAGSHGQVRYGYSDLPYAMGYAGYAFFPGSTGGGSVWISKVMSGGSWDWYRPDLILHETLHALGLKHPFEGGVTLDSQSDLIVNTVMSYSAMAGSKSGWMADYPREPMLLDIAALQSIYGASDHNSGDSVYDLASAQFQSNFHAVWDAGGWDTFDASRVAYGVTLDLREGAASDIGERVAAQASFGGATKTTTYTKTLAIADGTSIEHAVGSAFDDTFIAGGATRRIDGGNGIDTVMLAGSVNDYAIDANGGLYQLTRYADNTQTVLTGVERVEFSDALLERAALVANTDTAHYQQAFRLYLAALDRVPDQGGLIYQTRVLDSGVSLHTLAGDFIKSPEFQQRYGHANDKDFVTLLYHNVLDRAPDAGGLAYYLGYMSQGAMSREDVLVCFSESPENKANVQVELAGVASEGMLVPTF